MELIMTEKALNELLALEIPQEKIQIMQKHPLYEKMLEFCKMIIDNNETTQSLDNMPLGLLQDLQVVAVIHKMRAPITIIDKAIQANLKAQGIDDEHWAKKVAQRAQNVQQWTMSLNEVRQSMEKRLAAQEFDKDEC